MNGASPSDNNDTESKEDKNESKIDKEEGIQNYITPRRRHPHPSRSSSLFSFPSASACVVPHPAPSRPSHHAHAQHQASNTATRPATPRAPDSYSLTQVPTPDSAQSCTKGARHHGMTRALECQADSSTSTQRQSTTSSKTEWAETSLAGWSRTQGGGGDEAQTAGRLRARQLRLRRPIAAARRLDHAVCPLCAGDSPICELGQ